MPKVSQAHLDARRQHILDAARSHFATHGFARTSMADLVEACGLSVGSIYRYFKGKDEIITAICKQSSHNLPVELTHVTITGFLNHIRDLAKTKNHARLIAQIYAEAAVNPSLAAIVENQLTDLRQGVAARLPAHCQEQADEIAEAFVSLCQGYVQQLAVRGDVDPAPYADALATITSGPPLSSPMVVSARQKFSS